MGPDAKGESCFSHLSLREPKELEGKSVNALSGEIADFFTGSTKEERFEGSWPFCVESAGDAGLGRRAKTVAEQCFERIKGRMSRVAKLAVQGRPSLGPSRGLFVYLPTFDRAFACREAIAGGQRRMADDPQAPSRSYLKVEEAYGILGREPTAGETVVDLGAAPGGWSYSAARRGASVVAVDNGPLKGGAVHAGIAHRAEDAYKYSPAQPVDWLFCDMVDDPDKVQALLERWLADGWCRRFVVNLKFGRQDPLRILDQAQRLRERCSLFRARHLFHDREELTLVGERRA
jgi:23S rRNA (cytidine2498-2'-O)-methyltransferase